jgi:NosR/NirI family nitrous oxide reductase transcriptional regulator
MKILATLMLVLGALVAADAQSAADAKLQGQLKKLFPTATNFSAKEGTPPHFSAFAKDPKSGAQMILGYAFWTTELEPLERGYDGPIKILVGLDPKGVLSGIIVAEHREPYGYFSVDLPEFAAQFSGKDIRDQFKLGTDIDAISRATMSVMSSVRAVRNSSRRVARALLTPPSPDSGR